MTCAVRIYCQTFAYDGLDVLSVEALIWSDPCRGLEPRLR